MKNIILLLVLLSGMAAGYLIGDFRGRAARQALENAVRTGRNLDGELQSANAALKNDLEALGNRYKQDIEKSSEEYRSKSLEWQRAKNGLDNTIRRQNQQLAGLTTALRELEAKLDGAHGDERGGVEQTIVRLRKDVDVLVREMNGNRCLEKPVPQAVLDTLNNGNRAGSNQ